MPHVTITQSGRDGDVTYTDGLRSINGYWEFGGNDVVTIISMGTREEWQAKPWALDQRADILHFVAAEAIRQRAPTCRADIDEEGGTILLRQGPNAAAHPSTHAPARQAKAATFVHRLRDLKEMLATGLIVIALVLAGLFWLGQKAMTVTAVSGTPLNDSLRFEANGAGHPGAIATLIQTTDPHAVEISGRGGNTTTSLSLLLTPLDGSDPHLVPVVGRLPHSAVQLSRIMGTDGRTVWFDAAGLFGVRLSDLTLVTPEELRAANPGLAPSWWDDQRGMDIVDGKLHVMNADRSAALDVDPDTWKATATTPRPSRSRFERREVSRKFSNGVEVGPGEGGTLVVSRVDMQGKVLWSADTGLGRFSLKQSLPGETVIALIGERPPIPDRLSEPLIVLVDTQTGKLTTHTLWR